MLALRKGRAGEAYHFAGGAPRRNLDVVHAILDAVDAPRSLVAHVEDRPDHDRRYALDDAATRRELGWAPHVPFEAGLERTVDWYRDRTGTGGSRSSPATTDATTRSSTQSGCARERAQPLRERSCAAFSPSSQHSPLLLA